MAEPAPKRGRTFAEFLAYDDRTDVRCELVAMNPPAEPHARLTPSLFEALSKQLMRPCSAYFGGGVWIAETDHTWRKPDLRRVPRG